MKKVKAEKASQEFDRFKDLARRIMAVPKKEIDRKKMDYENSKTKRPAKS